MITTTHLTARYAETDQMQVIHHAVYPVWYEVARTEFIRKGRYAIFGNGKAGGYDALNRPDL